MVNVICEYCGCRLVQQHACGTEYRLCPVNVGWRMVLAIAWPTHPWLHTAIKREHRR